MLRKHRAPKGALRLSWSAQLGSTSQSQKAPSAKRCIKTCEREAPGSHGHTVRKHRAPKGALRLLVPMLQQRVELVRQKAPSAKRCIKTGSRSPCGSKRASVRKHRAPKGALRLGRFVTAGRVYLEVRKHRVPNGALRLGSTVFTSHSLGLSESTEPQKMHYDSSILDALDFFLSCQIVPSAIRRIKTCPQER